MTSEPFAVSARRLAGQTALLLGWRPDEFWQATPSELAAIYAARDEASGGSGMSRTELQAMMEHDRNG